MSTNAALVSIELRVKGRHVDVRARRGYSR